jgi:hypothetical protein
MKHVIIHLMKDYLVKAMRSMPINILWYNDEKTIIKHEYMGQWTLEEYNQAIAYSNQLVAQQNHRVDAIIDMTQGNWIPNNFLQHGQKLLAERPPNTGQIVIVGASPLVRTVSHVFERVFRLQNKPLKLLFAKTIEDGIRKFEKRHSQTE